MKQKITLVFLIFHVILSAQNQNVKDIVTLVIKSYSDSTTIAKKYYNNYILKDLLLQEGFTIDSALLSADGYKVILQNDYREILEKKDNKRIRLNHKRSIKSKKSLRIQFSYPIFTQDETIAIVFVQEYCGPLCGSGSYLIFKKVNKKWIFASWQPKWVS